MKVAFCIFIISFLTWSCSNEFDLGNEREQATPLEFGGDFSIMKKMEDGGGLYKINGVVKDDTSNKKCYHIKPLKYEICNSIYGNGKIEYPTISYKKVMKY